MQDTFLRVLLAAVISTAGLFGTYMWSRLHKVTAISKDPEPIARIVSSTNEVLRRPAQRLIWQDVMTHENLFAGEAVRTSSDAEASVEFIGQGTQVHLDQDTVIEIEKTPEGINLDFLKGHLVVQSAGEGEKITLQSGEEKIELKPSELLLSKPSAVGPLNVDVLKGQAQVIRDGEVQSIPLPQLKILSPHFDQPVYVDSNAKEPIQLRWAPIDSSYTVDLEVGQSRAAVRRLKNFKTVPGSVGALSVALPMGKNYFRLVAKSSRSELPMITSHLSRLEVRAKLPPQPLEPVNKSITVAMDQSKQTTFRWANTGRLVDLLLEVARSRDLQSGLYVKSLGSQLSHSFTIPGEVGPVYWRVSGRVPDTRVTISSDVQEFFLHSPPESDKGAPLGSPLGGVPFQPSGPKAARGAEKAMGSAEASNAVGLLVAPMALEPAAGSSFPVRQVQEKGIRMKWGRVAGASRYQLVLAEVSSEENQEPKTYRKEVRGEELSVRHLMPGAYKWWVRAVDEAGRESPDSTQWQFVVDGFPVLAWTDGINDGKIVYKTARPFLRATWAAGPGAPSAWRIRVTSSRLPASEQAWRTVSRPQYAVTLPHEGIFRLEAESIDAKGRVLARSSLRTLDFQQAPALAPPEFTASTPEEIHATNTGEAEIAWQAVTEAREYILSVTSSESGETIQSLRVRDTTTRISDLKTGDYNVSLQTVDTIGRVGPAGSTKKLHVPEYSEVPAPKIKSVNIK